MLHPETDIQPFGFVLFLLCDFLWSVLYPN